MTEYARIPDLWQGVLGLFALLAVFMYMYDLVRCIQLGRKRPILPTAALLLISLALMQVMMMNAYRYPNFPLGIHLHTLPAAGACALLIALAAAQQYRIGRWSRSHISAMSLKEAFDSLPTGLCYYLPGGLIKLVNTRMNALCAEILGAPLMDPEGFWRELRSGSPEGSLRGGEEPMLMTASGAVYSFRHRLLETELGTVHELTAVDVSEDYAMNRELREKRDRAEALNLRLRALLGSIEYLTMSRELMQLKTELHDRLGQSLLVSKRWLLDPESMDPEAVRSAWLRNLHLLESSEPESWQRPYYILHRQAEALGLSLEVRGTLPRENRLIPAAETAIAVHLTNVLRHAGGSRALVSCRREGKDYVLELTNDGMPPRGEAREGGGLGNLRSRVEDLGGSMEIQWTPAFRLLLRLPGEEDGE